MVLSTGLEYHGLEDKELTRLGLEPTKFFTHSVQTHYCTLELSTMTVALHTLVLRIVGGNSCKPMSNQF